MSENTTTEIIKNAMFSQKMSNLLSEEKLSIEFSSTAITASFDPKNRILTFPYSSAMLDKDIHELFMFHEISHAKHLPENIMDILKKKKIDFNLFNIVIDIRDERLIKQVYPGSIRSFNEGYKKLIDMEFFGDIERIPYHSFASRLNFYAKVGMKNAANIKFTQEEYAFYEKCMRIETIDEAIEATLELAKLQKSKYFSDGDLKEFAKKIVEENEENTTEEFYDDGVTDDELDDVDESPEGTSGQDIQQKIQEELEKLDVERTQEILDENFKKNCLDNFSVKNFVGDAEYNEPTIMPKQYFDYMTTYCSVDTTEIIKQRNQILTTVASMIAVFEAKKAAYRLKNAKISKTGKLDVGKLHKYKLDDKLFKSNILYPDAKSHGYVLLLDFSGSMERIFRDVIDQIIVLTEYFRRIGVKYKVIGFGVELDQELLPTQESSLDEDDWTNDDDEEYDFGEKTAKIGYKGFSCFLHKQNCIEFLNSEQSLNEHNTCLTGIQMYSGFRLGATPTMTTMIQSEKYIARFFSENRIQNKNVICITDGIPSDCYSQRRTTLVVTDQQTKNIVRSPYCSAYTLVDIVGKIFQFRYDVKFSTMFLTYQLNVSNVSRFVFNNPTNNDKEYFKQNGYMIYKSSVTGNKFIFAKPIGSDVDFSDFSISQKQTTNQISKQLTKSLGRIKKSRVFLNALAETLA